MTARDFCYWLQGYMELSPTKSLSLHQIQEVQKHLSLVFKHEIDPSFPAEQQEELNAIHNDNPYTNLRC